MNLSLLPSFSFPSFEQERLLVVGIGGGSDVISAFAIGQTLQPTPKEIVYANTKNRPESDWIYLSPHIAKLPPKQMPSGRISPNGTNIDRLLPKGDRESPLIFLLVKHEEAALLQEVKAQQFSAVIAVDTGGDCLATNGKIGRDQRMLSILRQVGCPVWLVVVGPGCDGQATKDQSGRDFREATRKAEFRGSFALDSILPTLRQFGVYLPATKTPNIIISAFECNEDTLIVPRGNKPALPTAWLKSGLAFCYGS